MNVVIVDYGLGNIRSVAEAVRRVGYGPLVSNKTEDLQKADKFILPGVGSFSDGMKNLYELGLVELLNRLVIKEARPILGICLGLQLMAKESHEFSYQEGLGWFDASAVKLQTGDDKLRVPHIGWNDLIQIRDNILFEGIPKEALFYYVHSYHLQCRDKDIVVGECEHGVRFSVALNKGNIYATQFHPEKSQSIGLMLLKNFLTKA